MLVALRLPRPLVLSAIWSAGVHAAALTFALHGGPHVEVREEEVDPQRLEGMLAGDTLDIEPSTAEHSQTQPSVGSAGALEVNPVVVGGAPYRASSRIAGSGEHTRAVSADGSDLFGAVGVRYAADLATAFAHAFPQAASADPVWLDVPFGFAGSVDVDVMLDETGHVVDSFVHGAPSDALRRGVERTLALLSPRVFTSAAAKTTLRLTARVAQDIVHDGLHGDVFALSGGSFAGRTGTAFFALPPAKGPGRRIDVSLNLMQ